MIVCSKDYSKSEFLQQAKHKLMIEIFSKGLDAQAMKFIKCGNQNFAATLALRILILR